MPQIEYYWIVSRYPPGPTGRLVVIGPKNTEEEARTFAYDSLDVPFEIVPLPTRDRGRATSILKAKHLGSTGNLGSALRPARHALPSKTPSVTESGDAGSDISAIW